MKTISKFFFLFSIAGILLAGCGKYEEGPAISVKSKTARLAQKWYLEQTIEADGDIETPSPSQEDDYIEFQKDGTFIFSDGTSSLQGTWEFNSDKSKVSYTFSFEFFGITTTVTEDFTILRLASNEFWATDTDGDEAHFKTK